MTNLFLSIPYNPEDEKDFWEEIFGCVTYLEIPYETVMNMPMYLRKYWIERHIQDRKRESNEENMGDANILGGEAINSFAKLEQGNN